MQKNYAPFVVGLFELRKNLTEILQKMKDKPVAIMERSKITGYLVPASTFEVMVEKLKELEEQEKES